MAAQPLQGELPKLRGYKTLATKIEKDLKEITEDRYQYILNIVLISWRQAPLQFNAEFEDSYEKLLVKTSVHDCGEKIEDMDHNDERYDMWKAVYLYMFAQIVGWQAAIELALINSIISSRNEAYELGVDHAAKGIRQEVRASNVPNSNLLLPTVTDEVAKLENPNIILYRTEGQQLSNEYSDKFARDVAKIVAGIAILRGISAIQKDERITKEIRNYFNINLSAQSMRAFILGRDSNEGIRDFMNKYGSYQGVNTLFHQWRVNRPVDSPCVDRNGLIVRVGEPFDVGDGYFPTYGGTIHTYCQCFTTPVAYAGGIRSLMSKYRI